MTSSTLMPSSFDYISNLVKQKSAIVLESGKSYLIESRLSPVARDYGLDSIEELVSLLQKPNSTAVVQKVVDAMTTNETSFFRDVHPFQALKTKIIPDLIRNRASSRTLNIWSNACSSGQEAYTIAMTIKESFPELKGWNVKLIASDLSSKILEKAKSGIFTQTEVNRGLPMPFLMKYFSKNGIQWKISDELRNMVEFRALNLIDPFPSFGAKMDIVFLRNVLIYFDPATKTSILNRVHSTMNADSYLFLGGAETTMNLNVKFRKEQMASAVCYRPE